MPMMRTDKKKSRTESQPSRSASHFSHDRPGSMPAFKSDDIDVSLLKDIANLLSLAEVDSPEAPASPAASSTPATPAATGGKMQGAGKRLGSGVRDFGTGFGEGFSGEGKDSGSGSGSSCLILSSNNICS